MNAFDVAESHRATLSRQAFLSRRAILERTFMLLLGGLWVMSLGCSSELPSSQVRDSQVQAAQALELERSGNIAEAGPLVQQAIEGGGLNPDQLSEAYLLRARWHCATDKLSEAEADLELAERGSPNPSSWHFTRAILLAKQGKAAESKSEFNTAKKIDPTLKMP